MKLPPGAKLTRRPKDTNIRSPFGSYTLTLREEGRSVHVESRLSLDRERITPAKYAAWRKFCASVDAASGPHLAVTP